MTRVAILGGGVAGLTAAHELAERGFEVVVLEARAIPGGKARSLPVPGSATGGRADLPAEHGFRFFPGFYRHVPDTMRRIPAGEDDRLRPPHRRDAHPARPGGRPQRADRRRAPARVARGPRACSAASCFELMTSLGIPPQEHAWLMERLLTLLTSCDERRYQQWELQSWWVFVRAEERSEAFRKFLADGLTRTLVAARAREISARTGGLILAQLLFDLTRAGGRADRVLDAPTNEAWIDPWVDAPARPRRRPAPEHAGRGADRARRPDRRRHHARRHGDRRLLRRGAAGRDHAHARGAAAARARAAARGARPARDALDERHPVLPRPRRAARARPRDLHRLRVGADVDLAGAVLGRRRSRALRRRAREGHPVGRRLGLDDARAPAPARSRCAARARRSAPRSGASSPTT